MPDNHAVIEDAIKRITSIVNVPSGLAHLADDARAKELFKALHRRAVPLNYDEIYSEAIKNSWSERHADELAQIGEKIGKGESVIIKHPERLGRANRR